MCWHNVDERVLLYRSEPLRAIRLPPHLQLLTLGAPLFVTGAGEQIKFRTRKHFALLIRLAVEAGRRFTRDYLMDLLWGDAPAHLARHSLAQALSVLKEKVGREHLVVQRATVALVEGALDADVAHLDACDLQIRGAFLDGFDVPAAAGFEQWKDEWRGRAIPPESAVLLGTCGGRASTLAI